MKKLTPEILGNILFYCKLLSRNVSGNEMLRMGVDGHDGYIADTLGDLAVQVANIDVWNIELDDEFVSVVNQVEEIW